MTWAELRPGDVLIWPNRPNWPKHAPYSGAGRPNVSKYKPRAEFVVQVILDERKKLNVKTILMWGSWPSEATFSINGNVACRTFTNLNVNVLDWITIWRP